MIELRETTPPGTAWSTPSRDADQVARRFLQSECSLAALQDDERLSADLSNFLTTASGHVLGIAYGSAGEILVLIPSVDLFVLVTGKTADVLMSYLAGAPVSVRERMDMTVRRRR